MAEAMRRPIETFGSGDVTHLENEIRGFADLQPGWNSYRAPAISHGVITAALEAIDAISRRRAPLPSSAAPTPLGGIALSWERDDYELQLLVDEDSSFDFSLARRSHPKVIRQGSFRSVHDVEKQFVDEYLLRPIVA